MNSPRNRLAATRQYVTCLLLAAAALATAFGRQSVRAAVKFVPDAPNELKFPAREAKFVRFVIKASVGGQPCIDELEVYAPDSDENLAPAEKGATPSASSLLGGYVQHAIEHLNDGQYGNSHSWIPAGGGEPVRNIQIEISPPLAARP